MSLPAEVVRWVNRHFSGDARRHPPQLDALTLSDWRQPQRAGFGDHVQLHHRVPVPPSAATDPPLDHGVRQLGPALPARIEDVSVLSLGFDDLRAGDLRLKQCDVFLSRRVFQKQDDEMPRIALGLLAKRILPDDALPFFDRAGIDVDLERETLRGFHLEVALQLRAETRSASEYEVSALEKGFHVVETQLREKVTEIGHADHTMSADVDSPQQRDVRSRRRRRRMSGRSWFGAGGRGCCSARAG